MKIPETLRWQATGKTLGEGGQGKVYEVTDKTESSGAKYALKVLAKGKPGSALARFYQEIAAIKQLNHRYVIKIIDHSQAPSEFNYYVMELIEDAEPLAKVIERKKSPFYGDPYSSVELFRKLTRVISACTAIGVVHRDLSPANILLHDFGSGIKVVDFGLCQMHGGQAVTLTDEGVGTVNYMAPECEAGAEGEVSALSDVYSAGKILWSAITGQRAFSREAPVFSTKSMNSIFPDHPGSWHLAQIFERTIRRNPAHRETPERLSDLAQRLKMAIWSGRPPIELAAERCPTCGTGQLQSFPDSHMVFGNPARPWLRAVQCDYCGYCFAINTQRIKETLAKRKTLE